MNVKGANKIIGLKLLLGLNVILLYVFFVSLVSHELPELTFTDPVGDV